MTNNSKLASLISVVLPIYNESSGLEEAVETISRQLESMLDRYELVCVNDGSTDNTGELLKELATASSKIIPINFSRNFGKEAAILAGLDAANGDAVVVMDSDLQHPPKLLPEMVHFWRQGYDVVECRKKSRGTENVFYSVFATMFNLLISSTVAVDMRGASDFVLLSRNVVDELRAFPERGRFFRGLVCWVGFRRKQIPFVVEERKTGISSWSTVQLIRYGLNNLFAFTTAPLYLTALIGLSTVFGGSLLGVQTLYNYCSGQAVSGFTTVILLLIFFSGIILCCIGIVAVYLAKVLEQVKQRPVYIISHDGNRRKEIGQQRNAE